MQKGERVTWRWKPCRTGGNIPDSLPAIALEEEYDGLLSIYSWTEQYGNMVKTVNVDELFPRSEYIPKIDNLVA